MLLEFTSCVGHFLRCSRPKSDHCSWAFRRVIFVKGDRSQRFTENQKIKRPAEENLLEDFDERQTCDSIWNYTQAKANRSPFWKFAKLIAILEGKFGPNEFPLGNEVEETNILFPTKTLRSNGSCFLGSTMFFAVNSAKIISFFVLLLCIQHKKRISFLLKISFVNVDKLVYNCRYIWWLFHAY